MHLDSRIGNPLALTVIISSSFKEIAVAYSEVF